MSIYVAGGMLQQLPNGNTAIQGGYGVYGGGGMLISIDQYNDRSIKLTIRAVSHDILMQTCLRGTSMY